MTKKARRDAYKRPEPPWTPETAAKLKTCQIRRLVEVGFLNASHQQAAYEVLKGFRTLAASGYRSMDLTSLHIRGNGEWSPGTERLMLLLRAWWKQMHDYALDPGYVYDLILDGATVPVSARAFLRRALDLYVRLPGFRLEEPQTI